MALFDALASMGLAGTTALIAVNFTHPIETWKTRLQVDPKFSVSKMVKADGVGSLWKGIQAAWLREASYTTIKLGAYGPIRDAIGANKKDAPFILKFAAGSLSGSIGSVVGNPFDVMKTKMMTDSQRPSLGSAMAQMYKDRGISGFYRGISANIMRACVLNGTKMACYDAVKGFIVTRTGWSRGDIRCTFTSAVFAGFFMTCTVAPFDMLRTTLMNQPTDRKIYTGFLDALTKIVKEHGPLALYRGFFPIWGRFAPQATLQLVIFDLLRKVAGFDAI